MALKLHPVGMHSFLRRIAIDESIDRVFELASKIEDFPKFVPNYHAEILTRFGDEKILRIATGINGVAKEMTVACSVDPQSHQITLNQINDHHNSNQMMQQMFRLNYTEWVFKALSHSKTLLEATFIYSIKTNFLKRMLYEKVLIPRLIVTGVDKLFSCIEGQAKKN